MTITLEGRIVMSDDQTHGGPHPAAPAGRRPGSVLKAAALLLPTLCLVAGAAWWLHTPPGDDGTSATGQALPPASDHDDLFHGWPKPDFAIVLSAQQHGYLGPCGCSDPQYGGLERRYNFIQALKNERGWPVVAYDLGDVPQKEGPAKLANVQGLIKYRYAMEAMKRMGYVAVGFGEYEAALPLNDAIDVYALNDTEPAVLGTNLINKAEQFPDKKRATEDWGKSYVASWKVTAANGTTIGALGVISTHDAEGIAQLVQEKKLPQGLEIPPSVGRQITATDPKFKFAPANKAIPAALESMASQKPDFRVLLYQGPVELAKVLPKYFAGQFHVILCLSQEDEPPGAPDVVDGTFIVRVGHKGKNIGVVGVNRTGNAAKPFNMRYQLVSMSPKYKTPKGKEGDNPILALMEAYTKELKADDYLAKYGKIPHAFQATVKTMKGLEKAKAGYAGSDACMDCHKHAFNVWRNSDHHKAYQTLVNARNPSLREYDAECIVCHTIGFRYEGGFENATKTPDMKDVGCESCHGPCELHVKKPANVAIRALINPWKAPAGETPDQKAKRILKIEGMCRECHDAENDVHWSAFAPKWAKVEHMTPPEERK